MKQVCKNTNTVMVENSAIQVRLRAHMYGIRDLPHLTLHDSSRQHISKHMVGVLINTQYRKEFNTYSALSKNPHQLPAGRRVADVQDGAIMVDTGRKCYIEFNGQRSRSVQRTLSQSSTFTWCSLDKVVVEARG
jgi:hypothetical protein